jgi:heme exporter protein B
VNGRIEPTAASASASASRGPTPSPGRTLAIARLIAGKDLRVELRSRVLTNQVLPFAGVVMVMFGFALDDESVLPRVAPGLIWLATLFSLLIITQRVFAVETADGALDALRVAGVNPAGVFLGKAAALVVQLIALDVVLLVLALVLYKSAIAGLAQAVLLVTTLVAATCGLAFVGTIYGGLAAGAKSRETLLPLLMLPVVAPVLIGATRATEAALTAGGITMREGWAWVGLLAGFAVLGAIGGFVSFGAMVEE